MTDNGKNRNDAVGEPPNHRARTYERPDFPYRCARERLWSHACGRGPNADGTCGGVSECLPTRKGDRWRCSRPLWAGGPCLNGPKPDGSCYTQRPPCRPHRNFMAKRRRAGLLAVGGSMAVIAAFFVTSSGLFGFDRNLAIPGPLTAAHANLIDGKRCALCHDGHERQGLQLAKALVEYQDITTQCSQCHSFDGQSRRPHNLPLADNDTSLETGCIGCHTEHKGTDSNIFALPYSDCHGCHEPKVRFERFADEGPLGHPTFSDDFGGLALSAIRFDHSKHFDAHFTKAEVREHRPEACTTCHRPKASGSGLSIPSFEEGCASCHEDQIGDQPLLLLTWPEMETIRPPDEVSASRCGMGEPGNFEDAEPVSYELPTLLEAFLMDVDPDDIDSYEDAYLELGDLLASKGIKPLEDLVRARGGEPTLLLAGLAPEIVANPACSWIGNQEYEGLAPPAAGGWVAQPLGLSYRPVGHADPVLKAWLEFAGGINDDDTSQSWASAFKASLFDPETGPGICASCHTPPDEAGMAWASERQPRRHTVFVHEPHLSIEEAAGAKPCTTCHEKTIKSSESSDFRKIGLETCQQCHGRQRAGEACALCHRYHPSR